jgi:hypothetical protein
MTTANTCPYCGARYDLTHTGECCAAMRRHVALVAEAIAADMTEDDEVMRRVPRGPIAVVDFDSASYVGDNEDGVYVAAAQGANGWYVSTVVDCNTAHFVQPLVTDDGPYDTEARAVAAGLRQAEEWCTDNEVSLDPRRI